MNTSPLDELNVLRSKDNERKRPNGRRRHDPFEGLDGYLVNPLDFTHETDFEWLSLNWRKFRAALISLSVRRLILIMFESNYQYFPTLREIKDGLVSA